MRDHITFKPLLDTCSHEELDIRYQHDDGFYRFVAVRENLAPGISDGTLAVSDCRSPLTIGRTRHGGSKRVE